jgi:hypothetical protein
VPIVVWYIFFILKGVLKPNLLPNIKDFQIIFVNCVQEVEKHEKIPIPIQNGTLAIPKPGFGHTLLHIK